MRVVCATASTAETSASLFVSAGSSTANKTGSAVACAYAVRSLASQVSSAEESLEKALLGGGSSRIAAAVPGCAVSGATAADTSPTNARLSKASKASTESRFFAKRTAAEALVSEERLVRVRGGG
jgi:hypothetical protein